MTDTAWIALSLVERVGGKTLRALLRRFHDDPRAVLDADADDLQTVPGIGPRIARSIKMIDLDRIEQAIPRWQSAGVRLITLPERGYPTRLRQLDDAPPTLFVRGCWQPFYDRSVAIVGTRGPSPEAEHIARRLASELAERGYVVISGLALGVDAAAHIGALSVPTGCTMAVLGNGVLNLYPPGNAALAQAILARGALVSELHPYAGPSAPHLVARNRIISGLSDQVIVVQTEIDGGAMHAARFALAQGRQLYVIDSDASGNRALLDASALPLRPDLRDLPF